MQIPVLPLQAILTASGVQPIAAAPGAGAIAAAKAASSTTLARPWAALTSYPIGAQVTPGPTYGPTAPGTQKVFLCLMPGVTANVAPAWNTADGSMTEDGSVIWFCNGMFLP